MSHRRNSVLSFFSLVGSAIAVSSAEEAGRRASNRDLRQLGIDPETYHRIRRS